MGPKSKKVKKSPISSFASSNASNSSANANTIVPANPASSSARTSTHSRVRSSNRTTVSRKITQSTISRFHTLLKQQSYLKRSLNQSAADDVNQQIKQELTSIQEDIDSLGGLNAYQIASTLGQSNERGGDSSKILVKWLDELGLKQEAITRNVKLRMLEIGALLPNNYANCRKWIDNHPIDLHSQHPDILEQDFFERPLPFSQQDAFDIVSCSLVLNFVSSPSERGRMLSLIHKQLRADPNRCFLFLVLPLPCLANSRYITLDSFHQLMHVIGFALVKEQWKPGGKVGYWLYQKRLGEEHSDARWRKKTVVEDGPKKNNFAVILP